MADNQSVESIIGAILKEAFGDAQIEDVHVVKTFGADGDEILRIYVVFNGTEGQFNAKSASGVVRHMRPRLSEELQIDAFPVISYLSSTDMRSVKDAVG